MIKFQFVEMIKSEGWRNQSSALKISEELSLFHFTEKIYNNTADLVKREVDIALEIIHHQLYSRLFLAYVALFC